MGPQFGNYYFTSSSDDSLLRWTWTWTRGVLLLSMGVWRTCSYRWASRVFKSMPGSCHRYHMLTSCNILATALICMGWENRTWRTTPLGSNDWPRYPWSPSRWHFCESTFWIGYFHILSPLSFQCSAKFFIEYASCRQRTSTNRADQKKRYNE